MLVSALLHALHPSPGAALGEQLFKFVKSVCGMRNPVKLLCLEQARERAFLTRAFSSVKDLELRRIAAVKDVIAAFAEAYKCAACVWCTVLICWKGHPLLCHSCARHCLYWSLGTVLL